MQALCQWDVQQDSSHDNLDDFLRAQEASDRACVEAARLTKAFWTRQEEIDKIIQNAAEKWTLSRMVSVERNTMRVAVVELLEESAPAKVAINEAIEIAREFGGENSPAFVNGILDDVWQQRRADLREVD